MPTFEIPDGAPTNVDLKRSPDGSATGSIVFKVTNKSTDTMSGRLNVVPSGSSQEGWFAIDGDRERNFAAGETQDAKITVTAPKDVASGEYAFKLRAVAVNDPDNDHTEGPVTTAKVPPPPPPPKPTRWWLWILIGLLVLAVLGVGGYFLVKALSGDGKKDVQHNTATADDGKVPDFTATPMTIEQAKAAAGGYDLVEEAGEATGKAPRTVIKQNPAPGTKLAKGSLVKLTFDPGVEVPALPGGATFASAPNTLKSAKLNPGQFLCDRALSGQAGQVGRVTGFSPASGTRVALNSEVNMIAVQPTPCPRILIIRPDIFLRTETAKTMTVTQRNNFLRTINTR